MLDLRIEKVDNGYIVTVKRERIEWGETSTARNVFNTWEEAASFMASLHDKFSK